MEIDIDRQKEAQKTTKQLLEHEERQRAKRRMLKLVAMLNTGNHEALFNDELVGGLSALISTYYEDGDREWIATLFEKLGEYTCSEDSQVRERALMALSLCMAGLQQQKYYNSIKIITDILLRWLRIETTFLSVCGTVCRQLQEYGVRVLEEGLWGECEYLLEIFHQIQSGILEKNNAIKSIVSRSQEAMATVYLLEELTLVCLHGHGSRRQQAEKILIHLGRKATIHLLDTLLSSKEREDRLRLIGIVPATGYVAVAVFKDYLQKDLPWYGVRNIILMITAMDNEELIPLIMPCLENEDIRIQQQVIDCISEVAETNQGAYLLEALPIVDDELKPGLVGYIGQLGESGRTEAFLDLLSQRDSFSPAVNDKLLQSLAVQVRLSDSIRAVNLLEMILEERKGQICPKDDPVAKVVHQTLHILKPRLIKKDHAKKSQQQSPDTGIKSVSFAGDPARVNLTTRDSQRITEEVTTLLGRNRTTEASQLLYEKCIEAARGKQFELAELLRDRILEVDPNALAEAIKADEIIEEEQSSTISRSHISIWQDLYDSMTTEEFNALYYTLDNVEYASGTVIVEQGANNPMLYFVNSGNARLTYWRGNEEIFIKKIGPGEIIGAEPFFDVSLWTVSLSAFGKTDVQSLEREGFLKLLDTFPGLKPCLIDYCLKSEALPDLLESSGEDRRQHPRYPVKLIVKHTLLNESGKNSPKSFKGKIADISAGGLSFCIRISRKEHARLLLGRGIKTSLFEPGGKGIDCIGRIVAVRQQDSLSNDYSVHVQFNEPVLESLVKSIINSN
ncbi:MAG: cyclic nucleotide-binding domain-containing protein [Desulfocapsa sp.]|uniref:Cyclic nucleotide-binding domain-containing protein n=1 Tax=Desulfotalea psychrophila TaxID=84980 RepID=A0ABS3AUC8_9BACT|nr:cyclic nucleotide-binding domain-containing protein [Desulfocapsa sp.]MBN4068344.1 cyclic nucleotide-binding domain-containing protein [Desulfotalea psychrophila]